MKNLLKKSLVLGFAYFCTLLINACCNCKDYQKPWYYNIEHIEAGNIEYSIEADTFFRTSYFTGDSLKVKHYGVEIYLQTKRIAAEQAGGLLQFSNAYACKCDIDNQILADTITEIHLKTLIDFDITHPAGSNVDEYFYQLQNNYRPGKNLIEYIPLNKVVHEKNPQYPINIYLNSAPATGKKVQFEIVLQTTKGLTYTDTTDAITLY